jgi:hypothetical protein
MSGTIFGLLVGINAYPGHPLRGCLNDVRAMREYLEGRMTEPGRLQLDTLLDHQATRAAIIERFRRHLGQAGEGDTALFFFAGHGSRERPPERYAAIEPDGWSETLMAFDSVTGPHLADKELRVLIAEVAERGAHVLVILDSCHSGSASRALAEARPGATVPNITAPNPEGVRSVAPLGGQRAFESYWFAADSELANRLTERGDWSQLPHRPHVLLSACEDDQRAKECDAPDGGRRGIFSYYLTGLLPVLNADTNYHQLAIQLRASVRRIYGDQTPQVEGNLSLRLFGGLLPARPPRYSLRRERAGSWVLEAGIVHGLLPNTELTVFDPKRPDEPVARVRAVRVGGSESALELLDGALPHHWHAAEAQISWLPLRRYPVAVRAEGVDSTEVEAELTESAYLKLLPDPVAGGLEVRLAADGCQLRYSGSAPASRPLLELPGPVIDAEAVRRALEHIVRWETLAGLRNPQSPLAGKVEVRYYRWRSTPAGASSEPLLDLLGPDAELRLPYAESMAEGPEQPRLVVELVNQSDRPLYFSLLALGEDFSVAPIRHGDGRVGRGASAWIRKLDGIQLSVPERLYQQGITQREDLFLLLLSERQIDLEPLTQGRLGQDFAARGLERAGDRSPRGPFEALLWRTSWREIDGDDSPGDHEAPELWDVRLQPVITERPSHWQRIDGSGRPLPALPGLTIQPPPGLQGQLRLLNTESARQRHPPLRNLPPEADPDLRPLALTLPTRGDPGLSVIELRWQPGKDSQEAPILRLDLESSTVGTDRVFAVCHFDQGEPHVEQAPTSPTGVHLEIPLAAAEATATARECVGWVGVYGVPRATAGAV